MKDTPYGLGIGTVQCYLGRERPWVMHFFGRAEYSRDRPILSDSIRSQAQPIVDALNAGTMSLSDALLALDCIFC
jgi:hypothetical protein